MTRRGKLGTGAARLARIVRAKSGLVTGVPSWTIIVTIAAMAVLLLFRLLQRRVQAAA